MMVFLDPLAHINTLTLLHYKGWSISLLPLLLFCPIPSRNSIPCHHLSVSSSTSHKPTFIITLIIHFFILSKNSPINTYNPSSVPKYTKPTQKPHSKLIHQAFEGRLSTKSAQTRPWGDTTQPLLVFNNQFESWEGWKNNKGDQISTHPHWVWAPILWILCFILCFLFYSYSYMIIQVTFMSFEFKICIAWPRYSFLGVLESIFFMVKSCLKGGLEIRSESHKSLCLFQVQSEAL